MRLVRSSAAVRPLARRLPVGTEVAAAGVHSRVRAPRRREAEVPVEGAAFGGRDA